MTYEVIDWRAHSFDSCGQPNNGAIEGEHNYRPHHDRPPLHRALERAHARRRRALLSEN